MKRNMQSVCITAIDVGTTKIGVLVGYALPDGTIDIIGIGHAPSDGLKKGVVVDIAKTVKSIRQAVQEAQLMSNMIISTAVIGISGSHIQSRNAYGAIPLEKGFVRDEDIEKVIISARAIPLAEGQRVLHVLPQFYSIDGQDRLVDPRGMHGIRLEVQVHIITGSIASVQNLITCCEMAGVVVSDIVLEQLASSYAVLTEDERELGVGMLDIGGGTADLALYLHGTIRHTMVVPIAGNHFTNDLAIGLRTTVKEAERIKRVYGSVFDDETKIDEIFEIETVHGQGKSTVSSFDVFEILEPRAQELLSIVHDEIVNRHLQPLLVSGLVLTGGGALLEGIKDVAQKMFNVPVRIGMPRITCNDHSILKSPMYATGYGLLLFAQRHAGAGAFEQNKEGGVTRLLSRMKSWVSDFF